MADLEKGPILKTEEVELPRETETKTNGPLSLFKRLSAFITQVSGLETRGIERVEVEERLDPGPNSHLRIFLLWLTSSLTGNNIIVGLYGPSFYGLNLRDAALCAVFGVLLGSMGVGYMSTWGPRSGNRTLVVARYFLGYYPAKLCCFLNILTMLGYAMVNCILGGQILFHISQGKTTVPVGIAVVAVLTWSIATFGMHLFHFYTRFAWILQIAVLCVLIGCAGPSFSTSSSLASAASPASRLSFFSLCFASAVTWSPSSADYFVYFPPATSRRWMFAAASAGMSVATILATLLGIGLATGVSTNPAWMDASLESPGSLLAVSYAPLKGFGRFCAVVLVVGSVSNNIPCTYSAGLNLQMLGRYGPRVPRPLLTTLEVVLYTVCAVLSHSYLREIVESFLPLMSYWIVVWLAICLEEAWIFRRGRPYDWTAWNCREKLPVGFASGGAFIIGCAAAVLGMSESFFVGPIARSLPSGCDLGIWLAFGVTAMIYPLLRVIETRFVGR